MDTAVAFFIFNRPESTGRVLQAIRQAAPPRLLVVADGPRADRPGEGERCAAARAVVAGVDWPCRVELNYSEVNLGCRLRVASGLDWVFDRVEQAIVLEDDCLPDPSFFRFCQELLARYRDEPRVGMISGDNFQFGRRLNDESYYFSRYFHVWGWATWKDRWQGSYDVAMRRWLEARDSAWLAALLEDDAERAQWRRNFETTWRGGIDTWDYQWVFANWLQERLCVLPSVNLVSNLGFDADATHTKVAGSLANLETQAMAFPLQHPQEVIRNVEADRRSRHRSQRFPLLKSLIGVCLAGWVNRAWGRQ